LEIAFVEIVSVVVLQGVQRTAGKEVRSIANLLRSFSAAVPIVVAFDRGCVEVGWSST
jgi:hypothetical protein